MCHFTKMARKKLLLKLKSIKYRLSCTNFEEQSQKVVSALTVAKNLENSLKELEKKYAKEKNDTFDVARAPDSLRFEFQFFFLFFCLPIYQFNTKTINIKQMILSLK